MLLPVAERARVPYVAMDSGNAHDNAASSALLCAHTKHNVPVCAVQLINHI